MRRVVVALVFGLCGAIAIGSAENFALDGARIGRLVGSWTICTLLAYGMLRAIFRRRAPR